MTKITEILNDEYAAEQFTQAVRHRDAAAIHTFNGLMRDATNAEILQRVNAGKLAEARIANGTWPAGVASYRNLFGMARALLSVFGTADDVFAALADYNEANQTNIVGIQGAYKVLVKARKTAKPAKPDTSVTTTVMIDTTELSQLSDDALIAAMDAIAAEVMRRKADEAQTDAVQAAAKAA